MSVFGGRLCFNGSELCDLLQFLDLQFRSGRLACYCLVQSQIARDAVGGQGCGAVEPIRARRGRYELLELGIAIAELARVTPSRTSHYRPGHIPGKDAASYA